MALRCAAELRNILCNRVSTKIISGPQVSRVTAPGRNLIMRPITTSSVNFLKEILIQDEGNKVIVEGVYRESPRTPLVIKTGEDCQACSLCALNLNLKHTDVLILSQFMRDDGCMLPRRVTGLCGPQQRRVTLLVAMSQKAGLMPNLNPSYSNKDPKKRHNSKKYNRYFDESTLDKKRRRKAT
ncbi:28S ribosomal protein S18a, mitochondrial-like [Homarus americanus]|uniref:28S ribosomal protein S18a-like n=1 Tax=Homarus americanus TaxID=6706 RepID=A0A8J5MYB5_HOMAM|nr:28S ribosomal protein S18a, mitochondrial-like [Homarus americanus]KAG7167857.1 28S ribosomal protein S18a-like [Homarus americanus]